MKPSRYIPTNRKVKLNGSSYASSVTAVMRSAFGRATSQLRYDIKLFGTPTALLLMRIRKKQILKGVKKGLISTALKIKRDALPLTPVDTGNLRASCYVFWAGGGDGGEDALFTRYGRKTTWSPTRLSDFIVRHAIVMNSAKWRVNEPNTIKVEIGFSAYYAVYVHEREEVAHDIGGAKFLEKSADKNLPFVGIETKRYVEMELRKTMPRMKSL